MESDGGYGFAAPSQSLSPRSHSSQQSLNLHAPQPVGGMGGPAVGDFPRSSSAMSAELNQSITSEGWQIGMGDDESVGKDDLLADLEGLDQFNFETNFETGIIGSTHHQHPSHQSLAPNQGSNNSLGSMGGGYLSLGSMNAPNAQQPMPLPIQGNGNGALQQNAMGPPEVKLGTGANMPIPVEQQQEQMLLQQQQQQVSYNPQPMG